MLGRRALGLVCAGAVVAAALTVITTGSAAADTGSTIVANAAKYLGDDYTHAGWPTANPAQEAWCADFLKRVWSQSGVRGLDDTANGIHPNAGSAWLYGVAHNTLSARPTVGAAVIFNDAVGSNPTTVADHVAIVTKVNANGTIESIGGNQDGDNAWNGRVVHTGPYNGAVGKPFGTSTSLFISGYAAPDDGSPIPALTSVTSSNGRLGYLKSASTTAAANGTVYVSTELNNSGSTNAILRARAGSAGPWEKYLLTNNDDGTVSLMSTANGKFVSVEFNYPDNTQAVLRARTDMPGDWEKFTIVASNGTFALRSAHAFNNVKAYVSAELGYQTSYPLYGELRARNTQVGDWERFVR
jgi:hypothetical protein